MLKYNIHILIVDDDTRIVELLKRFFLQNNFLVSAVQSVGEAKILLTYFNFDIAILDVMLPEITGIDFAKSIKVSGSKMPILLLTALDAPKDRIAGLEAGANDYLTKPFEPKELLLRVKNIVDIHRQFQKEIKIKHFGNNYYNIDSKEFFKNNRLIKLGRVEQEIFDILVASSNQVVLRETLSNLTGSLHFRSIDVQIARLRAKIEDNPHNPQYLKTIRGTGYALFT